MRDLRAKVKFVEQEEGVCLRPKCTSSIGLYETRRFERYSGAMPLSDFQVKISSLN